MRGGLRKVPKPKPPRERKGLDDPAHKKAVRKMRCLISGKRVRLGRWTGFPFKQWVEEEYVHVCEYDRGESDPHHTKRKSQLGHDHTCVPLCRTAHREAERLGNRGFKEVWGVDLVAEAKRIAKR